MKKLTISILLLIQVLTSFSQTFIETQFKDKQGNSYKGFMIYYSENNCHMRIAFNYMGTYQVVDVEYKTITGVENGIEYVILKGSNPKYITKNSLNAKYNPEHFIWLESIAGKFEKPLYTTDPEFNYENLYEVDYFNEITFENMSTKYLSQFYYSDELEFKNLSLALQNKNQNILEPTSTKRDITLHLFIVANTEISDIGPSCSIDKNNFLYEFNGIAKALNIKIKKYIVSGENYSKLSLMENLNSIAANPDDIIVFLYTGHGFRYKDQTDPYPRLDLRSSQFQMISNETSISLSEIYNYLNKNKARLLLVLGDCCNSEIGVRQTTTSSFMVTKANNNYDYSDLSYLFLKSKGSIISTAASPGEYSWSNNSNGGFFTSSFLQAFHEEISIIDKNSPHWDNIINNTIKYAKDKTSTSMCQSCKVQNGIKYLKVK